MSVNTDNEERHRQGEPEMALSNKATYVYSITVICIKYSFLCFGPARLWIGLGTVVDTLINVQHHTVGGTAGDVCVDGNRDDVWWRNSCCRRNQSLAIQMDKPNAIEAVYITTLEFCKWWGTLLIFDNIINILFQMAVMRLYTTHISTI